MCRLGNNKSFDKILLGDSLIAGLIRYRKVWKKVFKPLNAFNCVIRSDRVQHMLWRVHALRRFSFLINVVILCGTNNLYQDSLEDIENDLIIIASCFKQGSNSMNVFICGILPRDDISSINRLLIKESKNILKSSCYLNHINLINQNTNWINMSDSLKPDLFYSDKLHLLEKENFILAKSIYISVKNHYGSQNNYQLSKTDKSVTAFSLNNAVFSTLTLLPPYKLFSVVSLFRPTNLFIILLSNLLKNLLK